MPVAINGRNFCGTAEVCRMAGIGGNALFMWSKEGMIPHVEHHDRRGWRLFMPAQTGINRAQACHVTVTSRQK